MDSTLHIADLYQELKKRMPLKWLAGHTKSQEPWNTTDARKSTACPVGNLNLIRNNRIQVIGGIELAYLEELDKQTRSLLLKKLFTGDTCMIILADNIDLPGDWVALCNKIPIALFKTPTGNYELIAELRHLLTDDLAEKQILHGVFLEIAGIGLLLSGNAGVGKSELALELLSRGHRLIADDAPVFTKVSSGTIRGSCPALLQDFLEVRGLGILNIRAMFGDNAIQLKKKLHLWVQLMPHHEMTPQSHERLEGMISSQEVLGIPIPKIILPIAPGRNLAILTEAAALNHLLRIKGYNAALELQARLNQQLGSAHS